MSENPYAPPRAALARPQLAEEGTGTLDLGRCMQEAWRDTWANFPLWLGAGILWMLAALVGIVSILGILLVVPVLYWGGYVFFLKMHDGGARTGDLFSGFSRYSQALVGMAVYVIVNTLVGLPGQIAAQIGMAPPRTLWLVGVGYLVIFAVSLFVQPRLNFAPMLMVDRDLGIGDALSRSWSGTSELKAPLALLTLVMMLSVAVSLLALVVGVIPGTVFAFLLWVSAYRQIFGAARAS
jgi:uncharacterized membrane protein